MPRPEYGSYYLNKDGSEACLEIAEGFSKMTDYLETLVPAGRYMALAKTHLEIACMMASKAVAERPENQHGYVAPAADGTTKKEELS